jgi:hypothetical protein
MTAQIGDRFLAPGTKVCLGPAIDDEGKVTSEYGVVVHCWHEESIAAYDCYVAFFGDSFPSGMPTQKPYVLRYAATSLTTVTD